MSNTLAIAAVTSTMRHVLHEALGGAQPGPVGGADVTTYRPAQLSDADTVGNAASGLNVYLYQVTPNHAWNLTDLPTRHGDGSLARRPVAALDLHYLVTAYGDEEALEPQRLLARAALALASTPVLHQGRHRGGDRQVRRRPHGLPRRRRPRRPGRARSS